MKNLPELTDHITDPPKRASKDPASSAAENGVQNLPCTSVEGNVVAFSLMFTKGAAAVLFSWQCLWLFAAKPIPDPETKMIPRDPMTIAPSLLVETWYVDLTCKGDTD